MWNILSWKESTGSSESSSWLCSGHPQLLWAGSGSSPHGCTGLCGDSGGCSPPSQQSHHRETWMLSHPSASGILQTCCCFTTGTRFCTSRWESHPAQCRRWKGEANIPDPALSWCLEQPLPVPIKAHPELWDQSQLQGESMAFPLQRGAGKGKEERQKQQEIKYRGIFAPPPLLSKHHPSPGILPYYHSREDKWAWI